MFSKEQVNRGRQVELDLAKCLSIFFMIFLHCLMVTQGFNNTISTGMQYGISKLLGGPFAAPVFMFAMGVGMIYSKKQDPIHLITRGVKIMLLGVVVNVGEFFLPHYLSGRLLGKWDIFPIAGGLLLFCIDILAFAGLAMIVTGILRMFNLSSEQILLVAIILSAVGSFLRFSDLGSNVPNLIAGYFIGSAGGFTAFPLFNWFIMPAAGMVFGEYYIRCNDKKRFLRAWPVALGISVAYFVQSWSIDGGFLSEVHHYYFMTTIDALFCIICVYGLVGLCYMITKIIPARVLAFISTISSNVNSIYIVQWFIIPVTYILICYFNKNIVFNNLSLVIIALLEIVVSTAIGNIYNMIKRNIKKEKKHV